MRQIKRWIKKMLFVPNDEKITDNCFFRIMLTSVLDIVVCVICLSGLTWAWFSCSVTSSSNRISAADFSVTINVVKVTDENATVFNGDDIVFIENPTGTFKCTLPAGQYKVTIEATGTASTGYCTVEFNGQTYHTVQLYPGSNLRPFTFTAVAGGGSESELKITPQWGSYSSASEEEILITDSSILPNDVIINPSLLFMIEDTNESEAQLNESEEQIYTLTDSEQAYTVQEGDTLSSIAELYGTTEEILAAYNEISNPEEVQVGDTIKIPPKGDINPETPTSQPTDTESETTDPESGTIECVQNGTVPGENTGSNIQEQQKIDTTTPTDPELESGESDPDQQVLDEGTEPEINSHQEADTEQVLSNEENKRNEVH